MDREGVPRGLPGARAYRGALAALTSVYVQAPAVVSRGDTADAERLDARGNRAYRRLERLSDQLGISGC